MQVDPKNEVVYNNMKELEMACTFVVEYLGGQIDSTNCAQATKNGAGDVSGMTHMVLFNRHLKTKRLMPFKAAGKHVIWYAWIMESLFTMRRLDFESDEFKTTIVCD